MVFAWRLVFDCAGGDLDMVLSPFNEHANLSPSLIKHLSVPINGKDRFQNQRCRVFCRSNRREENGVEQMARELSASVT